MSDMILTKKKNKSQALSQRIKAYWVPYMNSTKKSKECQVG